MIYLLIFLSVKNQMNNFNFQMITTIIFTLLVAGSVMLEENIVSTILIFVIGILTILYLKGNSKISNLIDEFL